MFKLHINFSDDCVCIASSRMILISTVSLNNSSPSHEARVSLPQLMGLQTFESLVVGAEGRTEINAN